jgi:hypothetical protein
MAAISATTILATLQLSLIVAQAISASHVARTTARFVALRVNETDTDVVAQASAIAANLPGMTDGGMSSVAITPPCAALVAGGCPGRDVGTTITVTVNTNVTTVMLLPIATAVTPLLPDLPPSVHSISYTVQLE